MVVPHASLPPKPTGGGPRRGWPVGFDAKFFIRCFMPGSGGWGGGFGPRPHPADKGLEPAASTRWVFLLLVSGPAICWLSLSGRWFRGATDSVGRENRAAHRRSHRL